MFVEETALQSIHTLLIPLDFVNYFLSSWTSHPSLLFL